MLTTLALSTLTYVGIIVAAIAIVAALILKKRA